MDEQYDLHAVRELLAAAFSAGDIDTLAFDLFQAVYQNFAAGMTRDQKIKAIVGHAAAQGQIPTILAYTQQHNSYQYGRFAHRLNPLPEPVTPLPASNYRMQRLRDIQHHIEEHLDLLRQYEEALRLEDDPRRKARHRQDIEREKAALETYQQQAADLGLQGSSVQPASNNPQELLEMIQGEFDKLSGQLAGTEKRLVAEHESTRNALSTHHQAILTHMDASHRATVDAVLRRLDANQLEAVELLLDAADRGQIAQWEAQQLTLLAQQALVELAHLRRGQPEAAPWQQMLDILERDTGWEQKVKWTAPLIPGILSFESEAKVDVMGALNQAWRRLLDKIKS